MRMRTYRLPRESWRGLKNDGRRLPLLSILWERFGRVSFDGHILSILAWNWQ